MGQTTEVNEYTPGVAQFNDDYFAALNSEVQALLKGPVPNRASEALRLSHMGVLIDTDIILGLGVGLDHMPGGMAGQVYWATEPWMVHLWRTNYGIPYVGSLEGIGPRGGLDPERPMGVPVDKWSVPSGKIPTVYFDPDDFPGTMTRLHSFYPPPPPPPKVAPLPADNSELFGTRVDVNTWMGGPGANLDTVRMGQKEIAPNGKTAVAFVGQTGLMMSKRPLIYWTAV